MAQLKDVLLEGKEQEIERTRAEHTQEVRTLQEAWRIEPAALQLEAFVAAGGEGRVYRGRWRRTIEVAIKLMRRDPEREEDWGFSNAEVKAMQRQVHDYVGFYTGEHKWKIAKLEKRLFFVMAAMLFFVIFLILVVVVMRL